MQDNYSILSAGSAVFPELNNHYFSIHKSCIKEEWLSISLTISSVQLINFTNVRVRVVNYICVPMWGGCSSGRAGCSLNLLVRIPGSPGCMSKHPWARSWTPNCSGWAVGTLHGSLCHQRVNGWMWQVFASPFNCVGLKIELLCLTLSSVSTPIHLPQCDGNENFTF